IFADISRYRPATVVTSRIPKGNHPRKERHVNHALENALESVEIHSRNIGLNNSFSASGNPISSIKANKHCDRSADNKSGFQTAPLIETPQAHQPDDKSTCERTEHPKERRDNTRPNWTDPPPDVRKHP